MTEQPLPKAYGRFQCVRRIGEGGMGVVYEGIDLERGESVAIKALANRDPETLAAIKREFRALQDIHHPNLVTLHELVADHDDAYIAMELVPGTDLMTYIRGPSPKSQATDSPTAVDLRRSDTFRDPPFAAAEASASPRSSTHPDGVRVAASFDEVRLRDAFRQVVLGLSVLHKAGKVHRDVKPSNVRVTEEGRAVLLDFGLVASVSGGAGDEGNIVGTPSYMAPEQVGAFSVGPSADLYALGCMLYEALTGRRPFEGAAETVLLAKSYREPLPPSAFITGVPADLDALTVALLRTAPDERADMDEAMKAFAAIATREEDAASDGVLVGRETELATLRRAFEDVRRGGTVVVSVTGESGVGKSALVRAFTSSLENLDPAPLVLSGRCYERESVPYKALDEVIDGLSQFLCGFSESELLQLLPSHSDALALVFPAIARVPGVSRRTSIFERDVHERRRAAFRAFRQLLLRVSAHRDIVLSIDDIHWTDAESLALLSSILHGADAPPRLLLIVTRRSQVTTEGSLVDHFLATATRIDLGRLSAEDAGTLAHSLVEQHGLLGQAATEQIVAESGGHPLFIDELVRYARARGTTVEEIPRLDEVLWLRVMALAAAERCVLFVVCVLGVPVPQETVATAASVGRREFAHAVTRLRAARLVRTRGPRMTDAVEPFHDRVREAVYARIGVEERRALHGRSAEALEATGGADSELVAEQWAGAGIGERALEHTLVAATRATRALAFVRAARLYEQALSFLKKGDARIRVLREQLAEALANAGDSLGAAAYFEAASEVANEADSIALKGRAADQLVRAGRVRGGLELSRVVLREVGLPVPGTLLGTMIAYAWFRFLVLLRNYRTTLVPTETVPAEVLTRLDVCWSVSLTLPYADASSAGVCHARHVLLALRAGEPSRLACALGIEAAYLAATGVRMQARAEQVLALARATADASSDSYAQAMVSANEGILRCMQFQFGRACDLLEPAIARFRQSRPGSAFEISNTQHFLFLSMAHAGRYAALKPRVEEALEEAKARGDLFARTVLAVGAINNVWLVAGEPGRARFELSAARAAWPADHFHGVHYQMLIAEGYICLYDGEFERGYRNLHAALPALRRSLLLQLDGYRLEFAVLRARLALAYASLVRGRKRKRLVREAARAHRVLTSRKAPTRKTYDFAQYANVAILAGDREGALRELEKVTADPDEEAWLPRECARILKGRIEGDEAAVTRGRLEIEGRGGVLCDSLLRVIFFCFVPPKHATVQPSE